MPSLDHALGRYLELRNEIDQEMEEVILMAESRQA
jgi:dTDP-4-dehydrorhamnose reductase